MKRFTTILFLALVALATTADAQWTFVRALTPFKSVLKPNDLWGVSGFTVDGAGRLWVAPYEGTDTVTLGSSATLRRREIFVVNPDGSKASFSPIKTITVSGVIDSLNNDNSSRGLGRDKDGNIYYSSFDRIFKLNYQTGAGLAKVIPYPGGSITATGYDGLGNIYVSRVAANGNAIKIYTGALSFLANAVDTIKSPAATIARCIAASADGKTVYMPLMFSSDSSKNMVKVYRNTLGPGLGQYSLVDSFFIGMQVESINLQPRSGKSPLVWGSSGSRNNLPDLTKWKNRVWYGYDTDLKKVVDSIAWGATFPGNPTYDDTVIVNQACRPRGIAFSVTGDTAYIAMYLADSNSVKMFKKAATSVEQIGRVVPSTYTLSQNYPNPFNPSTEIQFSIPKAGFTTVKVYDMLGKEVATLVNESLNPGTFKTTLDGSKLSSGTYMYTLTSGDLRITKKMMLVK